MVHEPPPVYCTRCHLPFCPDSCIRSSFASCIQASTLFSLLLPLLLLRTSAHHLSEMMTRKHAATETCFCCIRNSQSNCGWWIHGRLKNKRDRSGGRDRGIMWHWERIDSVRHEVKKGTAAGRQPASVRHAMLSTYCFKLHSQSIVTFHFIFHLFHFTPSHANSKNTQRHQQRHSLKIKFLLSCVPCVFFLFLCNSPVLCFLMFAMFDAAAVLYNSVPPPNNKPRDRCPVQCTAEWDELWAQSISTRSLLYSSSSFCSQYTHSRTFQPTCTPQSKRSMLFGDEFAPCFGFKRGVAGDAVASVLGGAGAGGY